MGTITTCLELVGALAVVAGFAVLLFPIVGVGVVCLFVGVALVGLAALIEWRHNPAPRATGGETA